MGGVRLPLLALANRPAAQPFPLDSVAQPGEHRASVVDAVRVQRGFDVRQRDAGLDIVRDGGEYRRSNERASHQFVVGKRLLGEGVLTDAEFVGEGGQRDRVVAGAQFRGDVGGALGDQFGLVGAERVADVLDADRPRVRC